MHIEIAKGKARWSASWWLYAVVGLTERRCLAKIVVSGWTRVDAKFIRGCEIVPASDMPEDIALAEELRLSLRREKAEAKARIERMSLRARPSIPQPNARKF